MSDNKPDLMDILTREEDLVPELRPYVCDGPLGKMIHHPWLIEIVYTAGRCGRVNLRYKQVSGAIEKCQKDNNWRNYVWLHERAYRLAAFSDVHEHLDDRAYWELLGSIWVDTENYWQCFDQWHEFWMADRPGRAAVMAAAERKALSKLPSRLLTVYRGYAEPGSAHGLSWTRNKSKAIWFAKRFATTGNSYLCTGNVRKSDILAYLLGRNEKEIVVLPENVRNIIIEKL